MNDQAAIVVGSAVVSGLIMGLIVLPAGRWLDAGRKGKLAAFSCGALGFFAATVGVGVFKLPLYDLRQEGASYGNAANSDSAIVFWLVVGSALTLLSMLIYRRIIRQRISGDG